MIKPTNMTYFNGLNKGRLNSVNLSELFMNYSPKIDQTFAFCGFNGENISCESFFKRKITNFGVCATFDSDKLKRSKKSWTFGGSSGLIVHVIVRQEDFLIGETSVGFQVMY